MTGAVTETIETTGDVSAPGSLMLYGARFAGDKIICTHVQQVGDILNDNERMRIDTGENWDKSEDLKLAARIPFSVYFLWESIGITQDPKELAKALERNPEYKTTDKRLI